jgi:hypothetical protein
MNAPENLNARSLQDQMQGPAIQDIVHRSCNDNQAAILYSIMFLHNGGERYALDPCFNRGLMYQDFVPLPVHRMDLVPQSPGVLYGDFTKMPFADGTLQSVVADPPFLIGDDQIMTPRYGGYPTLKSLQVHYDALISESARVLIRDGLFVLKCQDIIEDRRKYFISLFSINTAIKYGFNLIDEYIKTNKSRPSSNASGENLNASRSYHSKFLVFRYRRGRRSYLLDDTKKPVSIAEFTGLSHVTLPNESTEDVAQIQIDFASPPNDSGDGRGLRETPTLPRKEKCYAFPCQSGYCKSLGLPCGKEVQNG